MEEVTRALEALMDAVNELPQSRERSLAITKIDEARLWLKEADSE